MIDFYEKILNCNEINQVKFDIESISYQSSIIIREASNYKLLISEIDEQISNYTLLHNNMFSVNIIQKYCEIIINLAKNYPSSDLINYQLFKEDVDNEINYLISNSSCFNPVNEILVLKYFNLLIYQLITELSKNVSITYNTISAIIEEISLLPIFNNFENTSIEKSLLKYNVEGFNISTASPISFKFSIVRNYANKAPLPANRKIIDIHNCINELLNFKKKLDDIKKSVALLRGLNNKQVLRATQISVQIESIIKIFNSVKVNNIYGQIHITNFLNNELQIFINTLQILKQLKLNVTAYDLSNDSLLKDISIIHQNLTQSICFK